jgi:hypothetical protein
MLFCKKFRSGFQHLKNCKLNRDFRCELYSTAQDLPDAWDELNAGRNFFLSRNYLKSLEDCQSNQLQFRYVLAFKKEKAVMLTNFQISDFSARVFGSILQEQLQELQSGKSYLFEHYLKKSKKKNEIVMRLVTCGNNFASGEHAFLSQKLKPNEEGLLLEMIIDTISKEEKLRGKISATLIKDFYKKKSLINIPESIAKFNSFTVEPNMIVKIPKEVKSLNEYIGYFSKKYRNRAKSILQKGSVLEYRELNATDIGNLNGIIYSLYESVFENAKFKLVKLDENYFLRMKESFADQFRCFGFFYNKKLVGFTSAFFLSDSEMEAHYIGFDYSINKEFEIYQNILYRFIEQGIEKKVKILNLGRTAAEIKSTVGAVAEELICYIKPQNTVSKIVLNPFISFLQPGEWIPRNPFKEETVS